MTIVWLNVGGVVYASSDTTLRNHSTFFSGLVDTEPAADGTIFIDRDPTHFRHILNWLRGVRHLPEDDATCRELLFEADYFAMSDLVVALKNQIGRFPPLTATLQDLSQRVS